MKSTGIIRKVDELGRIVIPKEIRKKLKLKERNPVEIYVEGSSVILKKVEKECICCGSRTDVKSFNGKMICAQCIKQISQLS